MLLTAAFAVLLHRYSGQSDFVVGTPIAGRTRAELEPLIGCFVNTLALRIRPGRRQTLRELVTAVRRTCLDAYANQDLPFESLVEKLQPERDLGRNPLFQFMFVLENAPTDELVLKDLACEWLTPEWTTARLDLTLSMRVQGETLAGAVEYSCDLFDAATIGCFVECFERALFAMVRCPDMAVARLPLSRPPQPAARLGEIKHAAERPRGTFLDAFAAQVDARPDAVAVEGDDCQLSYRELSERAHQLAHYLRAQGIGAGDRIAFCIDRSVDMLVGLLGVLEAGAAYVPLDPSYPSRRLAFMLQDCRPSLVLTEERFVSLLNCKGARVVLVDGERDRIAEQSKAPLCRVGSDTSPAYVIYTSGSTGQPKGVEVLHRGLLNLLLSMRDSPGLRCDDTLLAITTISFDIAALELFLPLVVGARIVLLASDVMSNFQALVFGADTQIGCDIQPGSQSFFDSLIIYHIKLRPNRFRADSNGFIDHFG
jgi:non-ribosomal peptide synthetase component F